MTPSELQKILRSDEKLTVKQVKEIIWQLKSDCLEFQNKLFDKELEKNRYNREYGFYDGEANAFYICLDLLEKVGDDEEL